MQFSGNQLCPAPKSAFSLNLLIFPLSAKCTSVPVLLWRYCLSNRRRSRALQGEFPFQSTRFLPWKIEIWYAARSAEDIQSWSILIVTVGASAVVPVGV